MSKQIENYKEINFNFYFFSISEQFFFILFKKTVNQFHITSKNQESKSEPSSQSKIRADLSQKRLKYSNKSKLNIIRSFMISQVILGLILAMFFFFIFMRKRSITKIHQTDSGKNNCFRLILVMYYKILFHYFFTRLIDSLIFTSDILFQL